MNWVRQISYFHQLKHDFLDFLFSLAAKGVHLWLDTSSINAAIVDTYKAACDQYSGHLDNKRKNKTKAYGVTNGQSEVPTGVYKISPILLAKAVKNEAELEAMRNAHLR